MKTTQYAVTDMARFPVAASPAYTEPPVFEKRRQMADALRPSVCVTVEGDVEAVLSAFYDGVTWEIEEERTLEDGSVETVSYDKSAFCLAGDVVDHRDGRVSFYMGKKTDGELLYEALEAENAKLLYENLTGGTY